MPDTVKLEKQWTVIVYLAGDNNLSSAGEIDLSEMKQVGSTNEINIVAQFDRADAGAQTSRYLLQKGTALENDKVMDLGETNMGDPMVLDSFAKWAIQQYPAKHYLLVLWNQSDALNSLILDEVPAGERTPFLH